MPLCLICQQITPWTLKKIKFDGVTVSKAEICNPHHRSLLALQESSVECEVCRLIYAALLANKYTPDRSLRWDAPVLLGSRLYPYVDPGIEAPQICEVVVQCGEIITYLHAFADLQSEAALSHAVAGRLPLDFDSEAHFEMITKWLEDCRRTHPGCRINRVGQNPEDMLLPESLKLPRRVIDVGSSAGSKIRLIESSDIEGQYIALSHRWPTDLSKHFVTSMSSINDRKREISFEHMPKTFQDAVKVSRQLGFQYLWIDSICIIQDHPEDWEQQSLLMGQIYHQATLTIMAATAMIIPKIPEQEQPPEGFLHGRPKIALPTVKMNYYDHIWRPEGNWFLQYRDPFVFDNLELLTRGWVMQEQLLSRRKVIYTPDQLLWQCKLLQTPEIERDLKRDFKQYKNSPGWQDEYFNDHWFGSVEDYSNRQLTFESDKLPALSGLALHFHERYEQEYYAGIFSGSIAEGLLWGPSRAGCLSRPGKYIAPSWSWASLIGPIRMKAPLQVGDNVPVIESALEDVCFKLFPEGQDRYGRLRGGKVELTGLIINAEMRRKENENLLLMELHADGKPMATFVLDLAEYSAPSLLMHEVACLYVLQDNENVLVLRKTRNFKEYERIGIATIDPEWFSSRSARKECIVIT